MTKRKGTKRKGPHERARKDSQTTGNVPRPASRPARCLPLAWVAIGLAVVGFFVAMPSCGSSATSQPEGKPQGDARRAQREGAEPKTPPPPSQTTVEDLKKEQLEVATRLVRDFPNNTDAIGLMGMVHNSLGNSNEAVKCWEKCLKLDSNRADAYNSLGIVAQRKGESEKAIALWRKALEANPTSPSIHERLAGALLGLGKIDEAVAVLENEIAVFPKVPSGYFLLGQAYLQLKEYEKAKQHYLRAIEIEPDAAVTYYGLGVACARLGQKDQAENYREKFKKLKAEFWKHDADQRGRPTVSDVDSMHKVVAKTFSDAAGICRGQGYVWRAEKLWRRAATLDEEDTACRKALASLYQQSGRNREALRMCEQLSQIDPENASYWMSVGVLDVQIEEFDDAEKAFTKVVELAPRKFSGYQALALLYLKTGKKLPQARALASRAVQLEPSASNYATLSEACDKNGDHTGALSAMKHAVELDGDNAKYRQKYDLLEKGK